MGNIAGCRHRHELHCRPPATRLSSGHRDSCARDLTVFACVWGCSASAANDGARVSGPGASPLCAACACPGSHVVCLRLGYGIIKGTARMIGIDRRDPGSLGLSLLRMRLRFAMSLVAHRFWPSMRWTGMPLARWWANCGASKPGSSYSYPVRALFIFHGAINWRNRASHTGLFARCDRYVRDAMKGGACASHRS